jgi:DNA-binding transcriptional ArsR family regulator
MGRPRIDDVLNELVSRGEPFSSGQVAEATGATRQAISRHLDRLLSSGAVSVIGKGRATRYVPAPERPAFEAELPTLGLSEDRLWNDIRTRVPALSRAEHANAVALTAYGFTEMVNNVIDHARATTVHVRLSVNGDVLGFEVRDDGIGVFENVRDRLGLADHITALQELSKGKVTTMPEAHTGEGLFFTSKAADHFELAANGLAWIVDNRRGDTAILNVTSPPGTAVRFEVALSKQETLESIFARYTHDLAFDTTRTVVKLFQHGVRFVSRSEAKRLLHGLERFRHVVLDFAGVEGVGQGFADEVFRVWARAHPDIELTAENMAPAVAFMIGRAGYRAGVVLPPAPA